ncbi:hypothetical protein [Geodermatophilus sp. CPCC 205506]|uniref:hypothetical protein n=1 Tax=Geodermatophilus sp. CPCC 205506 TaxID=2936596 RepID=UPI003EEC8433
MRGRTKTDRPLIYEGPPVELQLLAHAIRRSAVAVIAAGLAGALLGAAGWYLLLPAGYQATAVLVMDSTAVLVPGQEPFSGDPERYVTSEMELLRSHAIATEAAAILEPPHPASDVREAIGLSHVTGTDVVEITARAETPARARDMANAVASTYVTRRQEGAQAGLAAQREALEARVRELEGRLGDEDLSTPLASALGLQLAAVTDDLAQLSGPGVLRDATRVVDEAREVTSARSLGLPQAVLGGLLVGLLLGVLGAASREYRRPHVVSRDQVESVTGAPVAAVFPHLRQSESRGGKAFLKHVEEPTRRLLTLASVDNSIRPTVITVCSAAPLAGCSTIWSVLALTLARDGQRVLAVTTGDLGGASPLLLGGAGLSRSRSQTGARSRFDARPRHSREGAAVVSDIEVEPPDLDEHAGWRWHEGAVPGLIVSQHPDNPRLVAADILGAQPHDLSEFDAVVIDASSLVMSPSARSAIRAADQIVMVVPLPGQSDADLKVAWDMLENEAKADVHVVLNHP